jgi:uncharacterized coiled-coil protein SlyX
MSGLEDRIVELEIRYTQQEDLVEQLNAELVEANKIIARLDRRVKFLEESVRQVAERLPPPPNEKPPHY